MDTGHVPTPRIIKQPDDAADLPDAELTPLIGAGEVVEQPTSTRRTDGAR